MLRNPYEFKEDYTFEAESDGRLKILHIHYIDCFESMLSDDDRPTPFYRRECYDTYRREKNSEITS